MIEILVLLFVSISASKDTGTINESQTAQSTWWQTSFAFLTKYWWVWTCIGVILAVIILAKRYKAAKEEGESLPLTANENTRLSGNSNKELVYKKFGVKHDAIETVNIGIKEFSFSKPDTTNKSDTFKSPLNPAIYRPTPITEATRLRQ